MNHFAENKIRQTHVGGYNNGIMGMANVFYDFPGILQSFQPFLGFGIGYAWLNVKLDNLSPASLSTVHITTSAFAYQGLAGVTYNFSENYALNLGYRYLATPHVFDLGHVFQANLANIGVIYRFDNAKYK